MGDITLTLLPENNIQISIWIYDVIIMKAAPSSVAIFGGLRLTLSAIKMGNILKNSIIFVPSMNFVL